MLRDYQIKIKEEVKKLWNDGARNVCAVQPTGSGKSVVARSIVAEHSGASFVMAHRQELVSQLSLHLCAEGIAHRLVVPDNVITQIVKLHRKKFGKSFHHPGSIAAVGSVDTLNNRIEILKSYINQVTLLVVDEAAHVLRENKWGIACAAFKNAKGLFLTATPSRADGKGLGSCSDGIIDRIVIGPTTGDLIRRKYLSDYQIVIPAGGYDRSALKIGSDGDFTRNSLKIAAEKAQITGRVVDNYIKYALGRKTVLFASNIMESKRFVEEFNKLGIPAAHLDGNSDDLERYKVLEDLSAGKLWIVSNVDLFDEGLDIPSISCVIMARPTRSLSKFLQMIGRCLRPSELTAVILDLVGNTLQPGFGLPDRPRIWTLDAREKRRSSERDPNEIPITSCTECMKPYERIHACCPYCGHVPPVGTTGRVAPEEVDGDLLLLDSETLRGLREATELESPTSVANRVAYTAGNPAGRRAFDNQSNKISAQTDLKDGIAIWGGYGKVAGMTDQMMYRRFYQITGMTMPEALALSTSEMIALDTMLRDLAPKMIWSYDP